MGNRVNVMSAVVAYGNAALAWNPGESGHNWHLRLGASYLFGKRQARMNAPGR